MKKLITILVIVCIQIVNCDLPVHCIAREIHGQWNIIASEKLANITKQDCGHLTPDKNTDHVNNEIYKDQLLNKSIIQVQLQFPDVVLHHSQKVGRWSMIYDEGFEIRLFNGKIFFGFFKYNTTKNKVADDKDDEQSEGYNSECNETFLGWVYDSKKNDNWGCFYAEKINSVQEQKEYEQIQQMEQKMFDINRQIEQTENNDSVDTQQLQQQYLAQLYQDGSQKQQNYQTQDINLNQKINSSEGMDMESQLKLINEDFMKTNNLNQISNSNIETINSLNQMVFNNFKQIDQINNNVKQQQLFDSKVNMMNINTVGGINTVNQVNKINSMVESSNLNDIGPIIAADSQNSADQINQINKINKIEQLEQMNNQLSNNNNDMMISQNNVVNSNMMNNNGSYYDRLVKKQKLYDLPHQNFFTSFLENSEETYEPDYDFMNMINNQSLPWKAKIHPHFLNKTNQHMMNLIGWTRFKQIKQSQHIQKQYKQSSSFLQLASNFKLAANLQSRMKIKDKLIVNMQLKNKNKQKNRQDETQLSEFEQKLQQYLSTDNQMQKDYTSQIENQIFMEPCDSNKPDIEYSGSKIPRCYDWRSVNNTNYDTMISHQGDCGSCYVISALSALESRIRIKTGKIVKLSKSGPLSCTIYNQGCNGGYPELVYKYGMENGFYEDVCDIQKEYITDTQCNMDYCKQKHKQSIWKISNYGYVSTDKNHSYYGNTNELAMMKEIYHNGPVVIALNASPDLYYYSSGVFVTNPKNPLQENNMVDSNQDYQISSWMFTNHAVVCVGWGETVHEGQMLKYWILKNSWGEQWGENGYFKILRGHNLAAVENQAVFGDL